MKTILYLGISLLVVAVVGFGIVQADHNGLHSTPCGAANNVGGGQAGNSPGPLAPAASRLGWDVGSGQCNGSFTVASVAGFPGCGANGLELGMRAEQRRVGQVANNAGDYVVLTGFDPGTNNRAWWNFQQSIGCDGGIESVSDLDTLCFTIETQAGTAVPAPPVDLLNIRYPPSVPAIDDRRNQQDNGTSTYADLYQTSQNPLFGWLTNGAGGPYNIFEEGAWRLYLTALKDGEVAETSICIHTPNAVCAPAPPQPAMSAISSRALACLPAQPASSAAVGAATTLSTNARGR